MQVESGNIKEMVIRDRQSLELRLLKTNGDND